MTKWPQEIKKNWFPQSIMVLRSNHVCWSKTWKNYTNLGFWSYPISHPKSANVWIFQSSQVVQHYWKILTLTVLGYQVGYLQNPVIYSDLKSVIVALDFWNYKSLHTNTYIPNTCFCAFIRLIMYVGRWQNTKKIIVCA